MIHKQEVIAIYKMRSQGVTKIEDIDEYLDNHPCDECGHHYNDHFSVSLEEIEEARRPPSGETGNQGSTATTLAC